VGFFRNLRNEFTKGNGQVRIIVERNWGTTATGTAKEEWCSLMV
jgi:hypothetical protein